MTDHPEMRPTVGMIGGETIQIAEGSWPDEIGAGLAFSESGFDTIEPFLRAAYPDWTDAHRYGVFDLSQPARQSLVSHLRREASRSVSDESLPQDKADLLTKFAEWLGARCDGRPINVLGY